MSAYEFWRAWLALTSHPDDEFPVWEDVTSLADVSAVNITTSLGDSANVTGDPGRGTVTFDNRDQRFTPNNVLSPYYPNVRSSRRLRITETIGYYTTVLLDGLVEFPSIASWAKSSVAAPRAQTITVPVVDVLARLDRDEEFTSTLGAWVGFAAGNDMVGCWPFTDPSGSTSVESSPVGSALRIERNIITSVLAVGTPRITFASQAGPPGDDASYAVFAPVFDATPAVVADVKLSIDTLNVPAAALTYVALVMWVYAPSPFVGRGPVVTLTDSAGTKYLRVYGPSGSTNVIGADFENAGLTSQSVSSARYGAWQLISVRINGEANTLDVWVDDTLVGSTAAAAFAGTFTSLVVEGSSAAAIAYLQLLSGSYTTTAAYNRAAHLAQYQMGLTGLERQLTGERIRTLAGYAGFPDSALGRVDDGTVTMTRAQLAGRTAIAAMREAADTEQGLLYAAEGRPVFADRRRIFNI